MSDIDDDDINLSETDSIAPFDDLAMTKRSMRLGANRSGKATSGIFASVMKAAANVAVPAPTPPAVAPHAAAAGSDEEEEEEDVDFDDDDDDDHDDEFGFLDGEAGGAEPDDDWMRALDGTVKSFHLGSTRRNRSEPSAALADAGSPNLLGVSKTHGSFTSKLRTKLELAAVASRPGTSPATSVESPANGSQSIFAPRPSIFMQDPDDAALARLLGKPSPVPTVPPPNRSPTPPADGDDLLLLDEQEAVNVVYRRGIEMAEAGARRPIEDYGVIVLEEIVNRTRDLVVPFWAAYPSVAVFARECISLAHAVGARQVRASFASLLVDAARELESHTRGVVLLAEGVAFAKFAEQRALEAHALAVRHLASSEVGGRVEVAKEEATARCTLHGADLHARFVLIASATESMWRETIADFESEAAGHRRAVAIALGMGRIFELESAETAARLATLREESTLRFAACTACVHDIESACRVDAWDRCTASLAAFAAATHGIIAVVTDELANRSTIAFTALSASSSMALAMTSSLGFASAHQLMQLEDKEFARFASSFTAVLRRGALLREEASTRCRIADAAIAEFAAAASHFLCDHAELSAAETAATESGRRAQMFDLLLTATAEISVREAMKDFTDVEAAQRATVARDARAGLFGLFFAGLLDSADWMRLPVEVGERAARAELMRACGAGATELHRRAFLRALNTRVATFEDEEARARLDVAMAGRVEFGLLQARARVATADAALDRCVRDEFSARRALHAFWLLEAAELHKRGGVEAGHLSRLCAHRTAFVLGCVAVQEGRLRREMETHQLVSVKVLARPMQDMARCFAQEARARGDMAALRAAFLQAEEERMKHEMLALRASRRIPTPPTLSPSDVMMSRPRRVPTEPASPSHQSVSPVTRGRPVGGRAMSSLRSIDIVSEEFRVRSVWETQEARVRGLLWRLAGLQEWELRDREALEQRWVDDVAMAAEALRRGLQVRRGFASHTGMVRNRASSHVVRPPHAEVGPRPSTVGALPPVPPAPDRGRLIWGRPVSRGSAINASQRAASGQHPLHRRIDALPRSVALAALCYGPRPPTAGGGSTVAANHDRASVVFPGIGRMHCLTS